MRSNCRGEKLPGSGKESLRNCSSYRGKMRGKGNMLTVLGKSIDNKLLPYQNEINTYASKKGY